MSNDGFQVFGPSECYVYGHSGDGESIPVRGRDIFIGEVGVELTITDMRINEARAAADNPEQTLLMLKQMQARKAVLELIKFKRAFYARFSQGEDQIIDATGRCFPASNLLLEELERVENDPVQLEQFTNRILLEKTIFEMDQLLQ